MRPRALDRLVAEKILGWKVFRVGYEGTDDVTPEQGKYRVQFEAAGFESVGWYAWTGRQVVEWESEHERHWEFSGKIDDAMWVVNELKGWACVLLRSSSPKPEWTVTFTKEKTYICTRRSLCEAICRAALALKGFPVPC